MMLKRAQALVAEQGAVVKRLKKLEMPYEIRKALGNAPRLTVKGRDEIYAALSDKNHTKLASVACPFIPPNASPAGIHRMHPDGREVVPKPLCREGDIPSHLAVLKLPSVAPPRSLPRPGAYPMGSRFPLLVRDIEQRVETSEVSVPIRVYGTFIDPFGMTSN